jgi:hypothetical protein
MVRCDSPVHTVGENRLLARVAMLRVDSRAHTQKNYEAEGRRQRGKTLRDAEAAENHGARATSRTSA